MQSSHRQKRVRLYNLKCRKCLAVRYSNLAQVEFSEKNRCKAKKGQVLAACEAYLKRKHCCDNYKYDSRSLYADIDIEEELHLNKSNPFLRILVLLFFTFGGFLTM